MALNLEVIAKAEHRNLAFEDATPSPTLLLMLAVIDLIFGIYRRGFMVASFFTTYSCLGQILWLESGKFYLTSEVNAIRNAM